VAVKEDGVQGMVQLAVAAGGEPVADRLATRGRQRWDAAESGDGGVGADAIAV
jgi:hypothetical protein